MNTLAFFYSHDIKSLIVTAILVALAIWLIFYVLPLPQTVRTILAVAIAVLIVLWLIPGCATNTGNAATDQRGRVTNAIGAEAAKVVWNFALNSGTSYLQGQNGQAAASAAFTAAKTIQSYDGAMGFANIIRAAAGPQVAQAAQQAYVAANPQTPEQKVFVANSICGALQNAANSLP